MKLSWIGTLLAAVAGCSGPDPDPATCDSPEVLATGQFTPGGMALDATHAYWANWGPCANPGGSVARVPKGGGATEVVVAAQTNPMEVAVGGALVYWTNRGPNVFSGASFFAPKTGGVATKLPYGDDAFQVLVSGQSVYYSTGNDVYRAPLSATSAAVVATDSRGFSAFAIDAEAVYLGIASSFTGTAQNADGEIIRVSNGASPTTLAGGQVYPKAIVVDDAFVYWVTGGNFGGALRKVPKMGGAPVTLLGDLKSATSLAMDSSFLYVATLGAPLSYVDGVVMRVPKAGGAAVTIATGQAGASGIAVDATGVYWAARGDFDIANGTILHSTCQ